MASIVEGALYPSGHLQLADYILEGSYEIHRLGEEVLRLEPGDYVHVPRGTVHTYRCVGPGHGRMLVIGSPGGLETFFVDLGGGEPATDHIHPPVLSGPPEFGRMV